MTLDINQFEEKLRRVRPVDPPDAVYAEIARRIGEAVQAPRVRERRWPRRVAEMATVLAVCVTVTLLLQSPAKQPAVSGASAMANKGRIDELLQRPSSLAYFISLRDSENAFDRLLDAHSQVFMPAIDPESSRGRAVD